MPSLLLWKCSNANKAVQVLKGVKTKVSTRPNSPEGPPYCPTARYSYCWLAAPAPASAHHPPLVSSSWSFSLWHLRTPSPRPPSCLDAAADWRPVDGCSWRGHLWTWTLAPGTSWLTWLRPWWRTLTVRSKPRRKQAELAAVWGEGPLASCHLAHQPGPPARRWLPPAHPAARLPSNHSAACLRGVCRCSVPNALPLPLPDQVAVVG